MKIAAIQARPVATTMDELFAGADVPHAIELLEEAAVSGANVLCLPELYPGTGEDELRDAARRLRAYLIVGLLVENEHGTFNTATLIDPDGRVIGRQAKLLPTQVELDRGTTPGDAYRPFQLPIGNIGIVICADLVWSRRGITELKRQGADVIFNPSWWFALGEAYPSTIVARHLEYGLPVIGVNMAMHALVDRDGVPFPAAGGFTTIASPPPCRSLDDLSRWFRTKANGINSTADFVTGLGELEGILVQDIDVDAVRAFPGYFFSNDAMDQGRREVNLA